jgi:hypothetical protein
VRQQRGRESRRRGAEKPVMTMVKCVGGEELTEDDISNKKKKVKYEIQGRYGRRRSRSEVEEAAR